MGPVAWGYGLATLLAIILALCGPSHGAKGFALTLGVSWICSNFIYTHAPTVFITAYGFAWLDALAGGAVCILIILKPRVWNVTLALAALASIVAGIVISGVNDGTREARFAYHLTVNLLFAVSLVAVTLPTWCLWITGRPEKLTPEDRPRRNRGA